MGMSWIIVHRKPRWLLEFHHFWYIKGFGAPIDLSNRFIITSGSTPRMQGAFG